MNHKDSIREILNKYRMPLPPEDPIDIRLVFKTGDWWVKTYKGWYIFYHGKWEFSPVGP